MLVFIAFLDRVRGTGAFVKGSVRGTEFLPENNNDKISKDVDTNLELATLDIVYIYIYTQAVYVCLAHTYLYINRYAQVHAHLTHQIFE